MSKFHESIRDILEDIHKFLSMTLHRELLSTSALSHKEGLIIKLSHIKQEYPQLHLTLELQSIVNKHDNTLENSGSPQLHSPSSPPPYVDMHGGGSSKLSSSTDYICSNVTEDVNYDMCNNEKSSVEELSPAENRSLAESEDIHLDEGDFPSIAASELVSSEKSGFLEKKGRERLGGLLNSFQKRWCAVKDGVLYYYERSTDRRQKGAIILSGYETRPLPTVSKDVKKNTFCFELVCPGKRTYQFATITAKDLKQWVAAIERNSKLSLTSNLEVSSSPSHSVSSQPSTNNANQVTIQVQLSPHHQFDSEDIYEMVEEDQVNDSLLKLSADQEEPLYDEGESLEEQHTEAESMSEQNEMFNYQEWYVGLWDCHADDSSELNFTRGDLIHILSKEYDSYAWWIGELQGKVGLVPKSYLMEAYEIC